ncbi:hypothetical protein FK220_003060 [Flavobacteriaceae bacterium TP-CH-4]|uniref:Uncharacterized protein n=1 Tax=Pelagihabitans pacificus TaxID=2696054 RepID=A0A967E4E5_9FLAO|nr:hypothetical protein [Pelagihabitans pacificus]NHF58307.1 hypothetical protein [Pelagihabitans pacificus]
MDASNVMNFLLIAGAIHGFIFNIATFLYRRRIEQPVIFLNLFVFFLSMNNLQSWLIAKGYALNVFFLENFIFPWYVLIVPMFYAFLIHYFGLEKKKKSFLSLSIGIFMGEFLAQSIFLTFVDQGWFDSGGIATYNAIEDAVTLFYSLFIFSKVISLVFPYPQLNSSLLEFDNLKWIKRTIAWGGVIFILWGIAVALNIFSTHIKAPYSYYPLRVASSILIYWMGYQAFFRYTVFKDQITLSRKRNRGREGFLAKEKKCKDEGSDKLQVNFKGHTSGE